MVARTTEQAHRDIPEDRQDGWSGIAMDQALILPENHILDVVEAVLDRPVTTTQRKQALSGGHLRWQTGDPIADRLVTLPRRPPGPVQLDLGQGWPIAVAGQVGGGDQVASILISPMPVVARLGLPPIRQRQRGSGRVKEQVKIGGRVGWFSLTSSR